ncbi:MAG: FixJ family two-component response regulator [Bacteriovoracaceae bacterium]|jgi:FixJ family two-component response regulator
MEKYVLIDNDLLIRKSWEFAASKAGIDLTTFSSVSEFLNTAQSFPSASTTIYIDLELDDGLLGTIEAKKISDLGFPKIILATGHSSDSVILPSYFFDIVGKRAPF